MLQHHTVTYKTSFFWLEGGRGNNKLIELVTKPIFPNIYQEAKGNQYYCLWLKYWVTLYPLFVIVIFYKKKSEVELCVMIIPLVGKIMS